jgi:hypothetical protein
LYTTTLEEEPLISTKKCLYVFQSQSRCCDKVKSLCCPCWENNQNFPFIQSIAKSLYWPSHPITHIPLLFYMSSTESSLLAAVKSEATRRS